MKYRNGSHTKYKIEYHFVWIPKYRRKVFTEPYREAIKTIIQKIGYDYDIDIVELEIPADHIYLAVKGVPKTSPSQIMQEVKSISKNFLNCTQISKNVIFGEVISGLKVILWKQLEMLVKMLFVNICKTNWLDWVKKKSTEGS